MNLFLQQYLRNWPFFGEAIVSVIYCVVRNSCKTQWLKTKNIYYPHSFYGSGIQEPLSWVVEAWILLGGYDHTFVAGGTTSKVARSQLLASWCCLLVGDFSLSLLAWVSLQAGCLSVLTTWQLDSSGARDPREKESQAEAILFVT